MLGKVEQCQETGCDRQAVYAIYYRASSGGTYAETFSCEEHLAGMVLVGDKIYRLDTAAIAGEGDGHSDTE